MVSRIGSFLVICIASVAIVVTAVTLYFTRRLAAPFFLKMNPSGPDGVTKDVIAFGDAQALFAVGLLAVPFSVVLYLLVGGKFGDRRPGVQRRGPF